MEAQTVKHVYKAIAEVAGEIAKIGISKDGKNQQQNYKFRGIDQVYNALAPLLSAHNLVILTRVECRECVERTSKGGSAMFYVTLRVAFDFVSAVDGSAHTIVTYGEAMDSADKATNKAMSAAYKYACLQAFCIPTEGDNDADASTHEVEPAIRPVMGVELAELKTSLERASNNAELEEAKNKVRSAWPRMNPEQQSIALKTRDEATKRLAHAP